MTANGNLPCGRLGIHMGDNGIVAVDSLGGYGELRLRDQRENGQRDGVLIGIIAIVLGLMTLAWPGTLALVTL